MTSTMSRNYNFAMKRAEVCDVGKRYSEVQLRLCSGNVEKYRSGRVGTRPHIYSLPRTGLLERQERVKGGVKSQGSSARWTCGDPLARHGFSAALSSSAFFVDACAAGL